MLTYLSRSVLAAIGCMTLFAHCSESTVTPPPARALSRTESAIVNADNSFGLGMLRTLAADKEGENIFISPLSISMALGMTLNGARGETADSMRATLALHGLSQDEINNAYRTLIDLLRGLDPRVTFEIANSIWQRKDFAVEPSFLDLNRRYFDAEVAAIDFESADAVNTINRWVNTATHGRIPTIIDRIPPEMVMYLINALYFKGSWATKFSPDSTRRTDFTREDGTKAAVDLMARSGTFRHMRNQQFQAVDLPYGFDRYTMTVLLPEPGVDVDDVVASLTAERWSQITTALHDAEGEVFLPKLTFTWEEQLNDWLKRMGMSIAFDAQRADFTGINANGGLYISEVRHKTMVEINEEGTEAAAVTSVGVGTVSLPQRFTMRMDRPFIFAIRERTSGTIMFIGKVAEPG